MTEEEARARVVADVPRETGERLDAFVGFLKQEASMQNLIARSTLPILWRRHILDSAQLVPLAPPEGIWIDLGSGAGFPGLIVAALSERPIVLIEPRPKRAIFLSEAATRMGLDGRVTIQCSRAEVAPAIRAAVISARAVASLSQLFAMGSRFAAPSTTWLLPKGRNAAAEVAEARRSWQADLRSVPSITDSDAAIIVASAVAPRTRS